ncbi:hypothetical protein [Streptomyces sp. NPDC029003]|uniref:hypothetical protein n=1 Tax=Streptomyces sp. NPDC029003 TaxID=3155125 RepID=UPI0033DA4371
MTAVVCGACGNRVWCEKFSPAHTQLQWTGDAAALCPHLGAAAAAGQPGARVRACPRLGEAVEAAVREGRLRETRRDRGRPAGGGAGAGRAGVGGDA